MKPLSFFITRIKNICTLTLLILCVFSVCPVMAQSTEETEPSTEKTIQLVEPEADTTVIGKKPLIRIHINELDSYGNVIIMLDGADITNIIEKNGDELQYSPIEVMPAGSHSLEVVVYSSDGEEHRQDFTFNTRQSKEFDEAYSKNIADGTYRYLLDKCEDLENISRYSFDMNWSTESKLKQGNFDTTLTGNLRYLNQYLPVEPPEEEYLSLTQFLWETNYLYHDFRFGSDIGDVQINESPNTIEWLGRRGGKVNAGYANYDVNAFAVKSKELYGFNGGFGIGGSRDDHILGVSAGATFFSDMLEAKIIHITGGEEDLSYGMWAEETFKKGHVSGVVLKSNLFENMFQLETEYNASTYDDNTIDEYTGEYLPAEKDNAFRARADGNYREYTLGMGYEYFGPYYQVVGNPNIQRDWEGYNIQTGAGFEISSINLSFSHYNDNVEKDPLVARITSKEFLIDYSFTKIQDLLINATYQKITEKSSMEPDIEYMVRNYIDTYSGSAGYTIKQWNLGFQTTHSFQDDRTFADYDTVMRSYGITPAFASEYFSVSPSFCYDTIKDMTTHVSTDSYTASFNIAANIIPNRFIFEAGGSYNKTMTSDQLFDNRIFTAEYKLSYVIPKLLALKDTSFSIQGKYELTRDKKTEQRDHEHAVYFVISSTLPFSF